MANNGSAAVVRSAGGSSAAAPGMERAGAAGEGASERALRGPGAGGAGGPGAVGAEENGAMRTCGVAELRTPWGGHLVGRPSSVGALDWRRPRCAGGELLRAGGVSNDV